jgi:hypothetical protein
MAEGLETLRQKPHKLPQKREEQQGLLEITANSGLKKDGSQAPGSSGTRGPRFFVDMRLS